MNVHGKDMNGNDAEFKFWKSKAHPGKIALQTIIEDGNVMELGLDQAMLMAIHIEEWVKCERKKQNGIC